MRQLTKNSGSNNLDSAIGKLTQLNRLLRAFGEILEMTDREVARGLLGEGKDDHYGPADMARLGEDPTP